MATEATCWRHSIRTNIGPRTQSSLQNLREKNLSLLCDTAGRGRRRRWRSPRGDAWRTTAGAPTGHPLQRACCLPRAQTWTWAVPHSRTRGSVGGGRGQHRLHLGPCTCLVPCGAHPRAPPRVSLRAATVRTFGSQVQSGVCGMVRVGLPAKLHGHLPTSKVGWEEKRGHLFWQVGAVPG